MRYREFFDQIDLNGDQGSSVRRSLPNSLNESVTLNEVSWYDRSPLVQVLLHTKSKWIHFSRVPKIGVNPTSTWTMTGPYGVYLYPVSFILSRNERLTDGQQFGTDMPYYFLTDLDLGRNGLNLSNVSQQEAEALADRNGWRDALDTACSEKTYPSPGAAIWATLRRLNDHKTMSWNKALRGLAYVVDHSGIMYGHLEPEQIVVFDPKILSNVTMGSNVDTGSRAANNDETRAQTWKQVYLKVLSTFQTTYGGTIRWKENPERRPYDPKNPKKRARAPAVPSLVFDRDDRHFVLRVEDTRMRHGFTLDYKFGRDADSRSVTLDPYKKLSLDEVIEEIRGFITEVLSMEGDLRFKPLIDDDAARSLIERDLGSPGDVFDVEVDVSNGRYPAVRYDATRVSEIDEVNVETVVRLKVSDTELAPGSRVKLMTSAFLDTSVYDEYEETETLLTAFSEKVASEVRQREHMYGPSASYRWPYHFERDEQWTTFMGWFALNCGLSIAGQLETQFADEIAAYRALDEVDQDELHYKIQRVFNKR